MSACILIPACCEQVFVYGSNENYPPPVVQNDILFVPEGAFSYNIIASNYPLTFGATNLPAGLSVNSATGQIIGSLSTPGQYIVELSAYNGIATGTGTLTINVVAIPVVSNGAVTISPGSSFFFQIEATNHPFKYGAIDLPAGVQFNASTGVVSGVPQNTGTTSIPISATNVSGVGSATLTLTVASTNAFAALFAFSSLGTFSTMTNQASLDGGAFFTPIAGTTYQFSSNIRVSSQSITTVANTNAGVNNSLIVYRLVDTGTGPILLAGSTLTAQLSGTQSDLATAEVSDGSSGDASLYYGDSTPIFSGTNTYTYPSNVECINDAGPTEYCCNIIYGSSFHFNSTSTTNLSSNLTFQ